MTCKWLLILTGSGSIVSRGLAEFPPRLPKRPTLSIVCGFSYKPWPTVQYFNIIEQFWKTFWSRISLCYCYRGFWGIRHFEWTINTVKRGDLGNSTLLIILATSRLLPKIISDTFDKCLYSWSFCKRICCSDTPKIISFDFGHRQTDIFVVCCIGVKKALSLLVYRNSWYLDAQVWLLKVLF